MIKFSKEKVLLLHQLIIQETGGDINVRDLNLLDSALESAFSTFDGKDLFPTKEEKAAKIGYGLIANHAFMDGNKRIGMYVMLTFLEVNGITLSMSDQDIYEAGIAVASGTMDYNGLLQWVIEHK
ncbi:MAG TPA: type II toxin-antitoxin system death-on-curing family toxin [Firmicutes bacterium]|nr:type II toxin-antitoxin system death-on-curing family toxin [Bacillota bacterium]